MVTLKAHILPHPDLQPPGCRGSFMVTVNLHCPRCQSVQVYRHGQNPKGHDRFRCRDCHRVFQLTYCYEARKPGVKNQITEMAFNGAGVRDTARTLKIGINTVIRTLKSSRPGG
ncbi:iso-IS1 ORF1 [Shigella sonnei]|nr:iso-IS1 ORF1 [Shigella sonnei]